MMAEQNELAPIDQDFGREMVTVERPTTTPLYLPRNKDRWSGYNKNMIPSDFTYAFRAAEDGDLAAQADLFERMEEMDGALGGMMTTRRMAPTGLKTSVMPRNDTPEAIKAADLCRDLIGDLESEFDFAVADMMDAIGKSISLLEIDWVSNSDRTWVTGFRHIDPKRYMYPRDNPYDLRIRIDDNNDFTFASSFSDPDKGHKPPPFKIIAHRSRMRSGHPARGGVFRQIAKPFVIRMYAFIDWATYCEIFGMPLRLGKYPVGASDRDKMDLMTAVRMLGSDAAAIISKETEVEFRDSVARGVQPMEALQNACKSEYALTIFGQEATSVGAASVTGAPVQQMVRQDILEADCKQAAATIRRDLFYPLVGFNLGWEVARAVTPYLKYHYEPPMDLKTLIEVDRVLLAPKKRGGLGLPFTKKQLYARYGIEPPPVDAAPDEYLVQPEDEEEPSAVGDDAGRVRNQKGKNNDSRTKQERSRANTRRGSQAANLELVKSQLVEALRAGASDEEIRGILEDLTNSE